MSNLSLARKYRPTDFEHVVGQPHISKLLKKAIENGKISHSYLFTGTRGVGKTTMARLLALRLNCLEPESGNPCMKCDSCLDIINGNSLDVREIDGASNNGVDDIRSLKDSVDYAPTFGKFKIIIIDEVHMLSTSAFNALLKTLEEPPEHVVFIFATTEPHKIPDTILSRCQRYDFKRIADIDIVGRFRDILAVENVDYDDEALYTIAKKANGSMRDGLSLLDQIVSFSENYISNNLVVDFLGILDDKILLDLIISLKYKDFNLVMNIVEELNNSGVDFEDLLFLIVEIIRNMLIAKTATVFWGNYHKFSQDKRDEIEKYSKKFTERELLRILSVLSQSHNDFRYSVNLRMSFEIALYKITLIFDTVTLGEVDEKSLDNVVAHENKIRNDNLSKSHVVHNRNTDDFKDVSLNNENKSDSVVEKKNNISNDDSIDELKKFKQKIKDLLININKDRYLHNFVEISETQITIKFYLASQMFVDVLRDMEPDTLRILKTELKIDVPIKFIYEVDETKGFQAVDENDPMEILELEREKYKIIDDLLDGNKLKLIEAKKK